MITISNSQCEQIVRFLKVLCACIDTSTMRGCNIKRLSLVLIRQLEEKLASNKRRKDTDRRI